MSAKDVVSQWFLFVEPHPQHTCHLGLRTIGHRAVSITQVMTGDPCPAASSSASVADLALMNTVPGTNDTSVPFDSLSVPIRTHHRCCTLGGVGGLGGPGGLRDHSAGWGASPLTFWKDSASGPWKRVAVP